MSWWGWASRFRGAQEAAAADLSAANPENAPTPTREPLRAPRGETVWICCTPSGAKSAHETAQDAENRAALYDGAVVWPVTIELEETG